MKRLFLKLVCLSMIFIFCLAPLSAIDSNQGNDNKNVTLTDSIINDDQFFMHVYVDDIYFGQHPVIKVKTNVPDSTVNYYIYSGSTCVTGHEMDIRHGFGYVVLKDMLKPGNYTIKVVYMGPDGKFGYCIGITDFEVKE